MTSSKPWSPATASLFVLDTVPGKQKEDISCSAHSIAVNNGFFFKSCLLFEVDRNKASCKVIITWKEIMLDWDPRVLNDCQEAGSWYTRAVWQKYCKRSPRILIKFPRNSGRGTFPSWCILLLHEISTLSALCFLAGRRWIQSSGGSQRWQRGQQHLSVGLDEESRSVCFLCALGGPAITEWLRVSESAAQIYAHAFRCIDFGIRFWKCWPRALLPQQTGVQQLVCWFACGICISGGAHSCFPEMAAMNSQGWLTVGNDQG